MPVTKIDGSRSMAWTSPSERASRYLRRRTVIVGVSPYVVEEEFSRGKCRRLGGCRRNLDLRLDIRIDHVELLAGGNPSGDNRFRTSFHRTPRLPMLELLARAIISSELVIEVRSDMFEPAISHA